MSLRALLSYVAVWAALAVGIVVIATTLVGGDETVTLPPVQETQLASAARKAGCVLRSGPIAERGVVAEGPAGTPARSAVYDDERPPTAAIVAALRRGAVVIDYRPGVPEEQVEELGTVQRAVPRGTIVAPNEDMDFAIAVTAWRRLLGCRRITRTTLDAVQLFRGRFIGSGPDARR